MFAVDNYYQKFEAKHSIKIETLHVVDNKIYQIISRARNSTYNDEILRQASILYGTVHAGYRKNLYLDFSSVFGFRRLPWDLLLIVDEKMNDLDYLVVLKNSNEFLNSDLINRILQENYTSGCFVSEIQLDQKTFNQLLVETL